MRLCPLSFGCQESTAAGGKAYNGGAELRAPGAAPAMRMTDTAITIVLSALGVAGVIMLVISHSDDVVRSAEFVYVLRGVGITAGRARRGAVTEELPVG